MGKRLEFDDAARAALLRGVDQLAGAVRVTLGPRGRNVVLEHGDRAPTITDDGQTVASEIELADPFENLGARMVREAATATGASAGDGTTTATVLAHALVTRGLHAIAAGHDPQALRRGIEHAAAAVGDHLAATARRVSGRADLEHVATASAAGDAALGARVAEALERVGATGTVRIEDAPGLETTLEVVEGLDLPAGYLSAYFVTVPERMEAVLEHPLVLVAAATCSAARDLLPALEAAARTRRPLLVLAEEVDGEALATLVVNRLRGTAPSAAVGVPGTGAARRALLEDLAVFTGATLVAADLGRAPEHATEADLGRVRLAVIGGASTLLVEGGGTSEAFRAHLADLERERTHATRERAREAARKRAARLSGRIAVIAVGGATELERAERRGRAEDALAATQAALAEGVLTGGGVALVRAREAVDALPRTTHADEQRGREILRDALEEPARQIAVNAGADGALVVERLRQGRGGEGWDAVTGTFRDLDAAGILDPARVTCAALRHATAVGVLVLTTDAIVVDAPGEDETPPEA